MYVKLNGTAMIFLLMVYDLDYNVGLYIAQ